MLSSAVSACLLISSFHVVVYAFQSSSTSLSQCEPISIPQCKSMPYNETRFPNALKHRSQRHARRKFKRFVPLIKANCSEHLLFFLCAKSVPICLDENIPHKHPVRPCRSVCEKIKQDCMPVIRKHQGSWPKEHNCNNLPEAATGMCISPESFVDSCAEKCKRQKPMNFRKFKNGDFDFVLRVKVKNVTVNSNGGTTLEVKTLQALRLKRQCASGLNTRRISVNTDCTCAQAGKTYLLAAQCRDVSGIKEETVFLEEWKKGTLCRLDKWQKRRGSSVLSSVQPRGRRYRCKSASTKPAT